ncbi:hypothetical protein WMF04_30980 [Sorangium sp. So ce260]|uniref:hypothetical protein n=1 Tax=Sorangium sp. So ce260 TaxID=3133291 RepID=UPI003F5DA7A3
MPTFDVGATVEWTPSAAEPGYVDDRFPYLCVTKTNMNFAADKVPAPAPDRCRP